MTPVCGSAQARDAGRLPQYKAEQPPLEGPILTSNGMGMQGVGLAAIVARDW